MRKMLWMTAVLVSPVTTGCGSDVNEALLLAGESGARTALDVFVSDLYSDLPELYSLPSGPGEPAESDEDDGGAEQDDGTPTGGGGGADGDAQNGAALYTANGCFGCHCDDASGGCLPTAPNLQGKDFATIQEQLQGDTPHTGGKFDELTDQDIADLEAFLAEQADGGEDGGDGDAQSGAALYTANACSGCHCDDGSGGCVAGASDLQGGDFATIQEFLQGETPHMGGKFDELTDQDIADMQAFLSE